MRLEDRIGLVRGVVTVYQDRGSFEPITAYTMWYRHDAPHLEEDLQRSINALVDAYRCMTETHSSGCKMGMDSGIAYRAEWKDYRG